MASEDDETASENDAADFDIVSRQHDEQVATLLSDLRLNTQRKLIRRELTDPYNRLHSIVEDAEFVLRVADTYEDLILTPNLRCGLWYVPPERVTDGPTCYFKSTDGHIGQWSFSLKRFNPALLSFLSQARGVIIVDSTRRGKSFPDALSKTIPIWCAVVNRAVAGRYGKAWSHGCLDAAMPLASVGASEANQIQQLLPAWTQLLLDSTYAIPNLPLPLQCHHISPASVSEDAMKTLSTNRIHVLCVSASRVTAGGSAERRAGFNYVPGSGDDHESWAPAGLTPQLFWKHKAAILSATRSHLPTLLQQLVNSESNMPSINDISIADAIIEYQGVRLCVGHLDAKKPSSPDIFVVQLYNERSLPPDDARRVCCYVPKAIKRHLEAFSLNANQVAQRALQTAPQPRTIDIRYEDRCRNHLDFACALAVLLLVLSKASQGAAIDRSHSLNPSYTKEYIRQCHQIIIEQSFGQLVASRDILKRLNRILLSDDT